MTVIVLSNLQLSELFLIGTLLCKYYHVPILQVSILRLNNLLKFTQQLYGENLYTRNTKSTLNFMLCCLYRKVNELVCVEEYVRVFKNVTGMNAEKRK